MRFPRKQIFLRVEVVFFHFLVCLKMENPKEKPKQTILLEDETTSFSLNEAESSILAKTRVFTKKRKTYLGRKNPKNDPQVQEEKLKQDPKGDEKECNQIIREFLKGIRFSKLNPRKRQRSDWSESDEESTELSTAFRENDDEEEIPVMTKEEEEVEYERQEERDEELKETREMWEDIIDGLPPTPKMPVSDSEDEKEERLLRENQRKRQALEENTRRELIPQKITAREWGIRHFFTCPICDRGYSIYTEHIKYCRGPRKIEEPVKERQKRPKKPSFPRLIFPTVDEKGDIPIENHCICGKEIALPYEFIDRNLCSYCSKIIYQKRSPSSKNLDKFRKQLKIYCHFHPLYSTGPKEQ